ncbi:phosphogluconate dehydratase [Ferrimonas lipolytica]|uniref:Phosphogluconate dehydratase n=1 Tax=Ferrimonas lipolytica TaxID=2724191 RepID=A0A6H1UE77_9GAMM|nr:phosphogluconate dehydratase [Ferrimonas lipolytica]QIZ76643.1 phosphogluconate dehydratase [Ferrimonas lipolytica]
MTHPTIAKITDRIIQRSVATRADYLARMAQQEQDGPLRGQLSCSNLAHGFAGCVGSDKQDLKQLNKSNVGIITAYNDMLSAHQPYATYPESIKASCRQVGSVAQVAAGVPAMCDGVTQGQPGMELSLMSREVIAMATAVGLSHNMFDGTLLLGICDKIVPGLTIGALSFGHLPTLFVPAGPMSSGLPNKQKAAIRQQFAKGELGEEALLEAESASYHSPGTCTFYGTANSNQLVIEAMGLQLPGSSFVSPNDPLRDALTDAAAKQVCRLAQQGKGRMADIYSEKSVVNGIVALLATGGSTNLTMHLVAMARAAGIIVDWQDFAELSEVTPLLARIYPNGHADINHFHQAGGMAFLMSQLRQGGLIHDDVMTSVGEGLDLYCKTPALVEGELQWLQGPATSGDEEVLRPIDNPFQTTGGMQLLQGNLGSAVMKVSAVEPQHRVIEAPAVIFEDQYALDGAFKAGELDKDCIVVVRYQGPQANGMPELHKLTPPLAVLQDRGFKVALVTDGRMSGASGKVPAAIHVSPEALNGGLLAKVEQGDIIRVDAVSGDITLMVTDDVLATRQVTTPDLSSNDFGTGRDLFAQFRTMLASPGIGASALLK